MAKTVTVGIKIKGDSKEFISSAELSEKQLKELRREGEKTSKSFESMGGKLGKVAKGLGTFALAAGVAGAAVAVALTRQVLEQGDALDKLSISLDESVENLSRYQLVSDLSGVAFSKFQNLSG